MQQHLIVHGQWSKAFCCYWRSGLKEWCGFYVRPSTWPCCERNHILPVRAASFSSMPSLWVSMVPNFFGPYISLSATHTHHWARTWAVAWEQEVIPEASLLRWTGQWPTHWRPHFPFYLKTHLEQNLFKLIFFHSRHLAFSPLTTCLKRDHSFIPNKCFVPFDCAEPIAQFPF